jgi:hypothetical protein
MLAHYTSFEARVLEDHYIACAKREGIWGKGKPPLSPADKRLARVAGTVQGLARQKRAKQRKAKVLRAVREGYNTASVIGAHLKLSDTCVRRYLRELGELGFIQVQSICSMGGKAWMAVDGKKYDA